MDCNQILSAIRNGCLEDLEVFAKEESSFPSGTCTYYVDRRWVEIIVSEGKLASVMWMVNFFNKDLSQYSVPGDTPDLPIVHAALGREDLERYKVLKIVLDAGADPNSRGFHDYTPAHRVVIDNDLKALKILLESGADFSLKTRIDDYATPLEEAKIMVGDNEAIQFLANID